jgi:PST family polysaccharide transporter
VITKLKTAVQAKYVTGDRKILLSNFFSLSVLQLTNFLLPLLIFPYLVRVLGIDKYGVVAYAQAFTTFFVIITDYGFNLSATRDISVSKEDHLTIASIFNAVLTSKIFLLVVSFFLFAGIVLVVDKLSVNWLLYIFSYSIVIGQVLFPVWFFQGVQQMKYITILNITSKFIFTGLIFLLIHKPEDFIYVNLLLGSGSIVAGIISLYLVKSKFSISFKVSSPAEVKQQLKEGWHLFTSTFAINIYMNSNVFILGLFAGDLVVGFYSIAEKLMHIIRQLLTVFSQAVFPYVCKIAQEEQGKIMSLFKKLHLPFIITILAGCILLFVLAEHIVVLLSGDTSADVVFLVRLLSIVPFIVALNIPAYQLMLAYNFKNSYSVILITGSCLNIGLNILLAQQYLATGTAIAVLVTEIFITSGLYIVLKIKHPAYSII